jgi:23S rRNA (cytidine1920-2'-O)/16S rRNA (cytidine1409-2'-O)-methyltransferase
VLPGKEVILKLLCKKFSHKTKEELLAHILCGEVFVDGGKCLDPKALVPKGSSLRIDTPGRFVSRGGEKLDGLFAAWNTDVKGKIMIDAGSSTGGFTDCLLQRGAGLVYAVDVGFNQLDYSLRVHDKVKVMERVNLTSLDQGNFPEKPDAAVMDLAFRSIRGAAAHLLPLLREQWIIALIKPQFEWQNPAPDFDGVIRDKTRYYSILTSLIRDLNREMVYVNKTSVSVLMGRKGNREFFFLLEPRPVLGPEEIIRNIQALLRDLQ